MSIFKPSFQSIVTKDLNEAKLSLYQYEALLEEVTERLVTLRHRIERLQGILETEQKFFL